MNQPERFHQSSDASRVKEKETIECKESNRLLQTSDYSERFFSQRKRGRILFLFLNKFLTKNSKISTIFLPNLTSCKCALGVEV